MTYRQLRAKEPQEQAQSVSTEEELTAEQLAGVIRQSTTKQTRENLESADLQLSGYQRYAISQGLDADKIVVAWEGGGKRGVSGTLRIDQREELQEVMAGIEAGRIRRVWAYSVSRLFRDKYGVQVGTFMETCAKHGVKVVIETAKTFDFSNQFDVLIFQFLASVAARENEDRSRLLHAANKNKALRGEYDGRPLTPGFIVDRDKKSETYGRYIPYEPHKLVVRKLYARYRHRWNGQFNLLAHEVEQMDVVFPDFEDWVDKLDRQKFQFRKVPGGYHITPEALRHLLQSVEHAGYWKVDGAVLTDDNGQLVVNHKRIVDDDWDYAFSRLSPTTLTGEPNPDYVDPRATWQASTVKKQDREPQTLLQGILTSPLGTVHHSNGTYYVSEKRSENTNQRSNTLTIDAQWVEDEFGRRLLDRINDTDYEQMLYDALHNVQAHNTQALVSVDEQIARYEQTIANRQAVMAALGTKIDKATAEQYNQDIIDARANLNALLAKKNEASAEEQDLRDLCTELWEFRTHGKKTNEKLQRFIKLATDIVSIDEYSSHFIRLTVIWCTPFAQKDVCYFYRKDGGRNGWSEEDEADLAALYPSADRLAIMERFPTKTWLCIMSYANDRHIQRNTNRNSSGINDRSLSLADWELLQQYGWNREKSAHWLLDVPVTESDDLAALSG